MNTSPFEAPDTLAPYVARVRKHLDEHPGRTVAEIARGARLKEETVRVVLDRLASLKQVHCALRATMKRGQPPREYRPGPCPIVVTA